MTAPSPRPATRDRGSRRRRPVLKALLAAGVAIPLALAAAGAWVHGKLTGSLPQLDGERALPGLAAPVVVHRDALGVASVAGANRLDLARATGFVHAQDRFFQMDLLRRKAAGELAELLGAPAVESDRAVRLHRFADRAADRLASLPAAQRELLEAYAEGVNAGLSALDEPSFEYLLLRGEPRPWQPEDSLLVVYTLYLDLQGDRGSRDSVRGVLHDVLGGEMYAFLAPVGTDWDAPMIGGPLPGPPPPGPEVFSLRTEDGARPPAPPRPHDPADLAASVPAGSNGWAVAGTLTADGGALVANDMHLPLDVPNVWYRLSFARSAGGRPMRITGVSIPGVPLIVVGSNGHVAWGFTNLRADTLDLVVLEPAGEGAYRTPGGPRPYERHREVIRVRGRDDEELEVVETVWGPVVDRDHRGAERALRWIAHDPEAVDLDLIGLETARDVEEAVAVANRAGAPPQNFVVADAGGRIAWTVLGPIPRRFGHGGELPLSWADGGRGWDGYLAAEAYPRLVDPESGRLWSANNRVAGGAVLALLGDGGYVLGARARQIQGALFALESPTARDMLELQLDDRALFLERWRGLLLEVLTAEAVREDPRRGELAEIARSWPGRASVDSAGYRLVRGFHRFVRNGVFDRLTAACKAADERFQYGEILQSEGPLWHLVKERPAHLLPPEFTTWDELLLAAADEMIEELTRDGRELAQRTWGERNTSDIRHPLSRALPGLRGVLDMPPAPLPGDVDMPRFQAPRAGASQRMVVSPGREGAGFFHTPCGQSGHPLSPHYRDAHQAWVDGAPSPFLPGPAVHTLTLVPAPRP